VHKGFLHGALGQISFAIVPYLWHKFLPVAHRGHSIRILLYYNLLCCITGEELCSKGRYSDPINVKLRRVSSVIWKTTRNFSYSESNSLLVLDCMTSQVAETYG
jgi:hypothetical protein